MLLIGFRREDDEIEYLEEVEYSEEHLEDDLHEVIHSDPRLVMGTLTTRDTPEKKDELLTILANHHCRTIVSYFQDSSDDSLLVVLGVMHGE